MGRPKSQTTLNDKEKIEYRKLTDYIQEIYRQIGLDPPWNLFMTQIKDIKKNYKIGYVEILHVLQYMNQIENIDITERDTLGLIPYFIDKTNKYIEDYKQSKQKIANFVNNENVIQIKPNQNQVLRLKRKYETFD